MSTSPFAYPACDGSPATRELYRRLAEDRVILSGSEPAVLAALRRDTERVADAMEREDRPPPMLWSGIPFPSRPPHLSRDYCLTVSVGGTWTGYALLRLAGGEVCVLDPDGGERRGEEVGRVKESLRFPTPTQKDTESGSELISKIAGYLRPHLGRLKDPLDVVLSWGFPHKVFRTSPDVLGGVSARVTLMTKDQAAFTADLEGKDIGAMLREELERRLGRGGAVTVANDTVMALHYFLTRENLSRYGRFGLFINGTGTNFAAAEPYAVRSEGVVSRPGEEYQPQRITKYRPSRPGESTERYFVNYEAGSIELEATRTPYDITREYPIEMNALAGGNAFEQSLREIVRARISEKAYERLVEGRRRAGADKPAPRGPEVTRIATEAEAFDQVFPGSGLSSEEREQVVLICQAIVARSAFHAALVLAAISGRTGFGLRESGSAKPDLLAVEGSVWKTSGYEDRVRGYWQALLGGASLSFEFAHEKSYDASLPGPLYFAVAHGSGRRSG